MRNTNVWVFVGGNSNYQHIYTLQVTTTYYAFSINRLQFVWVLASSGFYTITWRMIRDLHVTKFIFKNSLHYEETFSVFGVISFIFFEFILLGNSSTASAFSYNQINKQPENLTYTVEDVLDISLSLQRPQFNPSSYETIKNAPFIPTHSCKFSLFIQRWEIFSVREHEKPWEQTST